MCNTQPSLNKTFVKQVKKSVLLWIWSLWARTSSKKSWNLLRLRKILELWLRNINLPTRFSQTSNLRNTSQTSYQMKSALWLSASKAKCTTLVNWSNKLKKKNKKKINFKNLSLKMTLQKLRKQLLSFCTAVCLKTGFCHRRKWVKLSKCFKRLKIETV